MQIQIDNYIVVPYPGNTCWKIHELSEEGAKEPWKEAKYYPNTLGSALRKVRELLRLSKKSQYKIDEDTKKLLEDLKEIDAKFDNVVSKLDDVTVKNFEEIVIKA